MQEAWVPSLGREDPLEKEVAIHSSTIAWKIPWTEKPSRLQPMGSQRVGHNWVTLPYLKLSLLIWTISCHFGKLFKRLNMEQLCDPGIQVWGGAHPWEIRVDPHKNLYMNVHSSIVHNSLKKETIQIPIKQMYRSGYVCANGILFSSESQLSVGMCHSVGRPSRHCVSGRGCHKGPRITWFYHIKCAEEVKETEMALGGWRGGDPQGSGWRNVPTVTAAVVARIRKYKNTDLHILIVNSMVGPIISYKLI